MADIVDPFAISPEEVRGSSVFLKSGPSERVLFQ